MRALLVISAIAAISAGGPAVALADPAGPQRPLDSDVESQSGCISTWCKGVYEPGDVPPHPGLPGLPPPTICMELVLDETIPPEDQWDGCILP